jgi:hypothetical protein
MDITVYGDGTLRKPLPPVLWVNVAKPIHAYLCEKYSLERLGTPFEKLDIIDLDLANLPFFIRQKFRVNLPDIDLSKCKSFKDVLNVFMVELNMGHLRLPAKLAA